MKLSKPTNLPNPVVATLASLSERYTASRNGYPTSNTMYRMAGETRIGPSMSGRSSAAGGQREVPCRARVALAVFATVNLGVQNQAVGLGSIAAEQPVAQPARIGTAPTRGAPMPNERRR